MDANGWRRILASNNFGTSGSDLRKVFADVIKKLCIEKIESSTIESFVACRLIPLDKNPGLRPIGVGEVFRRIAGKTVVSILHSDVINSVGSIQVCAGHEAGCEAAIHAMHSIFKEEETEAVLLVDAANAFNSINRQVFLHNISIICPSISTYVTNCYRIPSRLFVIGGGEIKSKEGTTQGDPVAMAIYALGITPLLTMLLEIITSLSDHKTKMAAYADDLSAAGSVKNLKHWWQKLLEFGPKFGYHPQASKTWLITKPELISKAEKEFHDTNIKITCTGQKHLGAVIGTIDYKNEYAKTKVKTWVSEIKLLSQIAATEPQAAYCAIVSDYKHKMTYYMRTIPQISELLTPLDEVITTELIPAITGGYICSKLERSLLSLPPKLGGLGLPIFADISNKEYVNSIKVTNDLTDLIIKQNPKYEVNVKLLNEVKNNIKRDRREDQNKLLRDIRLNLHEEKRRLHDINQELGASTWLTSLPIKDEGYVFNKQEFWDLIHIRYGWNLTRLPEKCACGVRFDVHHALICKKGGFITQRHNQLRNITAVLLKEVCRNVRVEL